MARFADVLRSLTFYAVFYGVTVLYVLASLVALALNRKAFIAVVHSWSRFHRGCVTGLLGIRVVVEGRLPGQGVLVALKHESFFEAIDLPNLLQRPAIMAKAELLRIPLWGRAGAAYGLVAVERDQGAKALRAMLTAARRLMAEGRPLAIFPEGTRVPHGERHPLQSGFAGLYKLLGLPVVPIAVDSGPCYQRRWKRRGTITIRIGEAIPPDLPRAEIEERVFAAINALNRCDP
jgi:1-acyl-sn-glycerol-3-phosphate acyltransferase